MSVRHWNRLCVWTAALMAAALVTVTQAMAADPTESGRITTAPGISLHFEKYGAGPQAVVIPNRLYMPEMRALAAPGRTLILYDMRNRGASGRVEDERQLTIAGDVEDLEAIRKHFGFEKMSLVGYSYLGLMVAQYTADHPEHVDRLVQIGPVPRQFGTPYPADQQADQSTLSEEGRQAAQRWRALGDPPKGKPDAELCRMQAELIAFWLVGNPANASKVPDVCQYENEGYAAQNRHLEAHFGDIQKRTFEKGRFTALLHPVLVIHGTMDRNAPYGSGLEWATTFRHARLVSVPGGAHQVWLDDPAVLTDIGTFLKGAWPARAQGFGRDP